MTIKDSKDEIQAILANLKGSAEASTPMKDSLKAHP